jgi:hypothetical protein
MIDGGRSVEGKPSHERWEGRAKARPYIFGDGSRLCPSYDSRLCPEAKETDWISSSARGTNLVFL